MSSIIEGFNYDIFISYRQKDNRHDGWVTAFVNNLKGELESTFKEEIGVYFDINPHDGLLETHDVDASLKEKLKCLVFIPIISRTYCDPKSFAWEHEFRVFVEQASKDQFGLKVKLPGGNVSNRVLPVQIHDLDADDKKLVESMLGGFIRGIEFIYKEPGVNRPLKPEDDEKKNLNNIKYLNQINKVANTIKDILQGLRAKVSTSPEKNQSGTYKQNTEKVPKRIVKEKPPGLTRFKLISAVAITAVLLFVAIFAYPKIFKRGTLEKLRSSGERISIAVMPFQNLTADTLFNIWQLGLQNLLITSLSNSEELSVRQYDIMEKIIGGPGQTNYASITPSFAAKVASKLEANTVIIGSIYKTGNRIRVTANLMDSRSEEIYKSYLIEGYTENDFFIITDSLSKLTINYLEINKLKNKYKNYDIKSVYTSSAEAFKYFILGRASHGKLDYNSAIELYLKSINNDTNFVSPMLMLAYVYGDLEKSEESKKWAYRAYSRIDFVSSDIQMQIKEVKAAIDKKPEEQIKYLKEYLEFNPYSTLKLYAIGWVYFNTGQWQNAIDAFEKGIKLNKQLGSQYKLWIWNYVLLGNAYHKIGEHNKEMRIYKDGFNLWPNEAPTINYWQSVCALSQNDTVQANEYLANIKTIGQQEHWSESEILRWFASIYYQADLARKAKELYQSALIKDPRNTAIKNELAYLLINKEIDIQGGTELVRGLIEAGPDNYIFMYTYGVGLLKQGQTEEAIKYLERSWESRPFYDNEHYRYLEEGEKNRSKSLSPI